jgi:hypothetical protein
MNSAISKWSWTGSVCHQLAEAPSRECSTCCTPVASPVQGHHGHLFDAEQGDERTFEQVTDGHGCRLGIDPFQTPGQSARRLGRLEGFNIKKNSGGPEGRTWDELPRCAMATGQNPNPIPARARWTSRTDRTVHLVCWCGASPEACKPGGWGARFGGPAVLPTTPCRYWPATPSLLPARDQVPADRSNSQQPFISCSEIGLVIRVRHLAVMMAGLAGT